MVDQFIIVIILAAIIFTLFLILRGDVAKDKPIKPRGKRKTLTKPVLKPIKRVEIKPETNISILVKELDRPEVINTAKEKPNKSFTFSGYQRTLNFILRESFKGNEVNFYTYYYSNRIANFTKEQQNSRRLIFDFKDGRTPIETANLVASCILTNYEKLIVESNNSVVFCIIPASTKLNNTNRYERFCKVVSENLQILNGYSNIEILFDRRAIHLGDRNVDRVANLKFNSSSFKGKTVFLFDDVFTKGRSFSEITNKIKAAGAEKVIGVFLGKTYYDG